MRNQNVRAFVALLCALVASGFVLANSAALSTAASSTRYLCHHQEQSIFAVEYSAGCIPLPVESGWKNVLSAPEILIDVQPDSVVRDGDTVKLWVRIYLNKSYPYETTTGESRGNYDGLKGVYKFFCHNRQQEIVQADYLSGETPIYYRLSNEAIVEEIEPGTAIETVYSEYCPS
jgi:hypothetical protein